MHGDGWVNVTPEAAGKLEASDQQFCHLGVGRQEQAGHTPTSSRLQISFFHESILNHSADFSDPYPYNHFRVPMKHHMKHPPTFPKPGPRGDA